MADASRFPRLAPPFAIVGACAGWLSASFLGNALVRLLRHDMQLATTVVACVLAAITGALLRFWCAGRRYGYQLVAPNPSTRLPSDRTWRHVLAMLSAGTMTGTCIGGCFGPDEGIRGAIAGTVAAAVFVPVGLSVVAYARRAQRARLGSIVAASDRRAVWGILAALLGATTLEAAPNWATMMLDPPPVEAVAMLFVSSVVVTAIFVIDLRAYHAFGRAVRDLELTDGNNVAYEVPERLDLGVGDEVGARLERSPSPYRGSDRAVALVLGDPVIARRALRRATLRGALSIGLLAMATAGHVAATTAWARELADRQIDDDCRTRTRMYDCWSRCW